MKILAITFDTELSGGANRSFIMVINELCKTYGHDVFTIIPGSGPIEDELTNLNLPYKQVELRQTGVLLSHGLKDSLSKMKANYKAMSHYIKAIFAVKGLEKEQFDIVYINGTSQLFGYYLAKLLKLPYVWHFRGALCRENYYVWNQRKVFNDVQGKIIVISNAMFNSLPITLGIKQERMEMIHNGLQWTDDLISKQDRTRGVHCVLCGRLVRGKGHMEAIEALRILHSMGYNDVFLHFAGDVKNAFQPYIKMLRDKINENQLERHIFFEGQVSNMSEFRSGMNIELMCSICEPFGRVTVEGMHSGLVVIGANTGGTIDIIADKINGFLYKQGDPNDLAMKIKYVIENEDIARSVARRARQFTETHFTVQQNVMEIEKVLSVWVGNKKSR